jgi:hypothetical protein
MPQVSILSLNRLFALTKLSRVIQDLTNPAFEVEGRHWRSNMTAALYFYFSALWTDDKVYVLLNFLS